MKKIFVAAVISMVALVGCSTNSQPAPVVTVTEQVPAPDINQNDGNVSGVSEYVSFVKENGGVYASSASPGDLINLGNIVCEGYANGMSQNDIVNALSYALVENNMDNEQGARFAAAIIVGAERYLCNGMSV
jgi:PBP1b-binding outer membrane lipoprotein LpoB